MLRGSIGKTGRVSILPVLASSFSVYCSLLEYLGKRLPVDGGLCILDPLACNWPVQTALTVATAFIGSSVCAATGM